MALKCPKCARDMEAVDFQGVVVDRCSGCRGIWFDAFEKEYLEEMDGAESLDDGDERVGRRHNDIDRIDCPHCRTQMIRMVDLKKSYVRFEHCATCGGSFLDAGEFREVKGQTVMQALRRLFRRD